MRFFARTSLMAVLALVVVVASGCVQVQRTDILTKQEGDKVLQADAQLATVAGSNFVGQIKQCGRSKGCIVRVAKNTQAQFAPVVAAYQEAADSVRGDCHQALQPIANSLGDIDRALGELASPAQVKNASKTFARAARSLPRNNSYLSKCSQKANK